MQRDDLNHPGLPTNGHGSSNGASATLTPMAALEPRFVIEQGPAEPPPDGSWLLMRAALAAFRRRWLLATSLGLICGSVAAVAAWCVIPAPFTAFAEIRIQSKQPRLIFTPDDRANFDVYKQTHMRMLKGYFVLQNAIRRREVANLSLIRSEPHPVDWLDEHLQVTSPGHEFLRVALSGENPGELAKIVNAVVLAYEEEVIGEEQKQRRKRLTELEQVHSTVAKELDALQVQFRRHAESMQVPNSEMGAKKQEFLLDRYLLLQQQYTNIDFEMMKVQAQLDALVQLSGGDETDEPEIPEPILEAHLLQLPDYQQVAAKAMQYEEYFAEISGRLSKGHASLRPYEQKLEEIRHELGKKREELLPTARDLALRSMTAGGDTNIEALKQKLASMEMHRARVQEELKKTQFNEGATGQSTLVLDSLSKDVAQKEAIERTLLEAVEKLRIELGADLGIYSQYRPAEPPHERDTKKKLVGTGAAGFGMFGLIVGGIVLLELRSRRISSFDEVADGLKVRVMGSLPLMPRSVTGGNNGRQSARSAYWHSALTESIDATRTMLLRGARDESQKVVMIASAMGGEGKTTLSCHLAASLARARRNVLLVDCDMRRPNVNRVFGLSLTPGLCEVLRGEAPLEDAIRTSSTTGLSILPAGKISQDVLQILAQDGIDSVLKELRQQFDFVIVDSSPVLPVTDSLLIAQHVDGVIFSIRRDVSRAAKVAAALQRMSMLHVPLLGAVVIGLDDGSYGFSYGYRYGGYGYGYGYRNADHSLPQTR